MIREGIAIAESTMEDSKSEMAALPESEAGHAQSVALHSRVTQASELFLALLTVRCPKAVPKSREKKEEKSEMKDSAEPANIPEPKEDFTEAANMSTEVVAPQAFLVLFLLTNTIFSSLS